MARPQVKKKPVSRQEKVPAQTKIPMREQANDVVLAMDIDQYRSRLLKKGDLHRLAVDPADAPFLH